MDLEKKYWKEQIKKYNSLNYNKKIRYYSWQPARWAGNNSAVKLMSKYFDNIENCLEIGAGSAAFSISIYNYNNKIKPYAIDISKTAVKYGNTIANDLNIPLIYHNDDLFKYQGKYDLVFSLGVIEHFNKNKMEKFIKKCIELTNKYILIAIPNQESVFFKNYVSWSEKKSKKYCEKHKKFTNDDLKELLVNMNLKIILEDGFQMFLSEPDFLSEDTKNNLQMIKVIKKSLYKYDIGLSEIYPNKKFDINDIDTMTLCELNLSKENRLKYSFMTFILAKIV
jgi:2-polyprenyl-3-methyl-5-hydroxy-6-metoxy-1,4-benzoquinol methylase